MSLVKTTVDISYMEQLLKEFPVTVKSQEISELSLSEINYSDAALIWELASRYVQIAKEVNKEITILTKK